VGGPGAPGPACRLRLLTHRRGPKAITHRELFCRATARRRPFAHRQPDPDFHSRPRVRDVPSPSEITELLICWGNGDRSALEQLLPLVERELHRLAHNYMRRENAGHTLQTTALINETYLRLMDQSRVSWQNRAQFFGIAAQIMRRVLLNYARDRKRAKRGGGTFKVSLSLAEALSVKESVELIALDEALGRLAQLDERKSRVVELRHFGGLSVDETAEVLQVSAITVMRDWNMAKAWLARELGDGNGS
jgi:RNA polymerase sigma-70 factor, ECF subfamily